MPMSAVNAQAERLRADEVGWLGYAAAPVFASMACLSAVGAPDMAICSAAALPLPLNEMAVMYLLMGNFHLSPWTRLLSARSWHRPSPTIGT